MGRTGQDFMDLAKPGLIKEYCLPNALTTFKEYLIHYAHPKTQEAGATLIEKMIGDIPSKEVQQTARDFLKRLEAGEKDLYL